MLFQDSLTQAQKYFPDLQVKYKDTSPLMKLLGTIMFFNKSFMTDYTTTLGSTVYYPSETFVKNHPVSALVILYHELMHIHDSHKISKFLFTFLYLCPQVLALLVLPLLFLLSWKIVLPMSFFFLLPIPAFFRMHLEKRAYSTSLYVINALSSKLNFPPNLATRVQHFSDQFNNSYYYFMWPFQNVQAELTQVASKVSAGQKPFPDPFFDILDDLLSKVQSS